MTAVTRRRHINPGWHAVRWSIGLGALCLAVAAPGQTGAPILAPADADNLPIRGGLLVSEHPFLPYGSGFPHTIRNRLSIHQVRAAVQQGKKGIIASFDHVRQTLDGQPVDPSAIYGSVVFGPYPFESAETAMAYMRLRRPVSIRGGRAEIDAAYLLRTNINSEDWTDSGQISIRMELFEQRPGRDLDLGVYDTFCMFRKQGNRTLLLPSIVDGPLVNLVRSDAPSRCVISLETSQAVPVAVVLGDGRVFESTSATTRHEVTLSGLTPDTSYTYSVRVGDMSIPPRRLRTAPARGATGFRFGYGGDSRGGPGLGLESHMGCNFLEMSRLAALAYRMDCRFLLQGGDLVNGYTSQPDDYRTQLFGWKHAVSGFASERPIYPAMGNHECLIYFFQDGPRRRIRVDMWPYATQSSESIFAEQLVLPENGPDPTDPRRPSYRENVFSFQYGCVKSIAVNNNYWISYAVDRVGGSPEGYILDDQLAWIKAQLQAADADPTVRYVVVYMQEPVLPNGGHVKDAMWYKGNNRVRAATWTGTELEPEAKGIIEVRNELMTAIHGSTKTAAVLGSDEHAYSKVLIDSRVPLGVPATDDKDGDGHINYHSLDLDRDGKPEPFEDASPLPGLKHPVWYFVGGGFGAPYYAEEKTPWNAYWRQTDGNDTARCYYSSQSNVLMFEVTDKVMSVTVLNPFGEVIDRVADLMAARRLD